MKIYYDSSLWSRKGYGKGRAEECKAKQKINWEIEYLGKKHYIPYIYRFKKGIVFDIITPISDESLRNYIEKSNTINFEDENQRRSLEEEHPYQTIDVAKFYINGEKVERGGGSSSSLYSPLEHDDGMYKQFKKAYKEILKDKIHFGIQRFCIQYPETVTGFRRFRRNERGDVIKSLGFETFEVEKYYPIEKKFKLSSDKPTYELEIEHPITQQKYVLSFKRGEEGSLQIKNQQIYTTSATYEINPPLKEGERLNIDNSISYNEEPKSESECAASTGIIGGADGPTALCIMGKTKRENCFSKITFESQEEAEFELKEMYITIVPRQIYEYKRRQDCTSDK